MKLFAKRTKKVASASSKQERTVFQSDPVCEELLKQDPSTWNAKQRRMIRRYQERKKEAATDESSNQVEEKREIQDATKDSEGQANEETAGAEELSSSDSSSESSDEEESENEKNNNPEEKEVNNDSKSKEENEKDMVAEAIPAQPSPEENGTEQHDSSVVEKDDPKESDLSEILDRLDSKTRRKLRRKLDRGEASEVDIRKEAMAILEPNEEASKNGETGEKRTAPSSENTAEESTQKSKKRRKVDWSSLPPEERMRREDQRRRQQEVAALREAGELPLSKHRHPLNSERRRANRRKPKWERKSSGQDTGSNHHNASGFQMRKSQAAA